MNKVSFQHIPGLTGNFVITPQKKNKEFIEQSNQLLDFMLGKKELPPFPVPDHLKGRIGWYIDVGWYMNGDINSFGMDWISDIADKTYLYEGLQFVIDHLLVPFGYKLNGDLFVEGNNFENDVQLIHVSKNKLSQRLLSREEIDDYLDSAYGNDSTNRILVSTKAAYTEIQREDIPTHFDTEFQEKGFWALTKEGKETDLSFNFFIIEQSTTERFSGPFFILAQGCRNRPPFLFAKTIPWNVICGLLFLQDESSKKLFKTDNVLYIRIKKDFSYLYGQSYILHLHDIANVLSVVSSWSSHPPILEVIGSDVLQFFDQCVLEKKQRCVSALFTFLNTRADLPEGPLEDMPEIQELLKETRTALYFNPQRALVPIPSTVSKMGGQPLTTDFDVWPICDVCSKPLHFVLQIFKKEFSQFYFPENTDVFFLFRCANNDCPEYYSNHEQYDTKLFWFYHNESENKNKKNKKIIRPHIAGIFDEEINECFFQPFERREYSSYDCNSDKRIEFEKKYSKQTVNMFQEKYEVISGTKIRGYPTWVQDPIESIQCSCGKLKEYFFQLSGEEPNRSEFGTPNEQYKFSDHGLVLVDIGTIYFFVCTYCGPQTIETRIQFS